MLSYLLGLVIIVNYADGVKWSVGTTSKDCGSSTCSIRCDNDDYPYCVGKTINCGANRNCEIQCDYDDRRRLIDSAQDLPQESPSNPHRNLLTYSCSGSSYGCCNSIINCAAGKYCQVDCSEGCSGVTINAATASELYIKDCKRDNNNIMNCNDMTIYCPTDGRLGSTNKCRIQGDSSSYSLQNSYIYTEEGYNDINIEGSIYLSNTQIFCGKTTSEYSCIGGKTACNAGQDTTCNNYIIPLPTQSPTADPTNDPTSDPTKDPTVDPTADPTKDPTADPTNDPTKDPTSDPTKDPTNDPTADPTNDPTNDPTRMPTKSPTVGDNKNLVVTHGGNGNGNGNGNSNNGEVGVGTTSGGNSGGVGDGNYEAPEKDDTLSLPSWIYVVAGCGAMICCLAIFLLICKCRTKKEEWDNKFGNDDNYRFNANNQTQPKGSMDVWSNPVHHQVGSVSPSSVYEGNNNNTTGIARIGSNSLGVFDDEPSSGEEVEHGQMYTVPVRNNPREQFGQHLINNAAAQSVAMDDIIGHMSTPMGGDNNIIGDDDADSYDDHTSSIEMANIGGTAGENGNIVIPNDDNGIDAIDNDIGNTGNNGDDKLIDDIDAMNMMVITAGNNNNNNNNDDDDDIAGDIDQIITPNGNENDEDDVEGNTYKNEAILTDGISNIGDDEFIINDDELSMDGTPINHEDDNQILGDIDNIIVTAGINDNDDIDDIDNNDVNTAGYVGHDEEDDDDMDDFVQTIQ